MVKSDQAVETRAACKQLGRTFEGTLENRFPHNSTLERDIRTIQEVARACHLQAGFDIVPGLWMHSIEYAAVMFNAHQKAAGKDQTRHMLAVGVEFSGRKLLLGQLVHYHVDASQRVNLIHHPNRVCSQAGGMIQGHIPTKLSTMSWIMAG